jgi:carboxyl-terminal processing protease
MYQSRLGLRLLWLGTLALCLTCSKPAPGPDGPSSTVKFFYENLFDIVEKNAINRKKINWVEYRQKVLREVGYAQTVESTESAMKLAMSLLQDNHSLIFVDNRSIISGGISCGVEPATQAPAPQDGIGYVQVLGFTGSGESGKAFAEEIQAAIATQDKPSMKGWIVDLRRNSGGNMYPMIAGVGPLLGNGLCGYFYDADDKQVATFAYEAGRAMVNNNAITTVDKPYTLLNQNIKVAVLISNVTGSSGEATAIAFVGKPNVRLFGNASCGQTTGNQQFTLLNPRYVLNLFVVNMVDRNRKIYGVPILPDEVTTNSETIDKAIRWINQ